MIHPRLTSNLHRWCSKQATLGYLIYTLAFSHHNFQTETQLIGERERANLVV